MTDPNKRELGNEAGKEAGKETKEIRKLSPMKTILYTIGATILINLAGGGGTIISKNGRLSKEGKSRTTQILENGKELVSGDEIRFEQNKDGNIIGKILHPGDLVVEKGLPEQSETRTVTVHYEVAPKFEDSESIDPEKYEAIKDSIQSELNKSIQETLIGFDFVKKSHEGEIGNTKYTIVINSIEGHASPEGYKFLDESLTPGKYEEENKQAAERRAQDAEPYIKEAFLKIISETPELSSQIDTSSIHITGEELQITQEEYDRLDSLRIELGYKDIVTMIEDNNSGKVTDAEAVKIINEIINSKRNVIITYTIKGHPKDIYVIPMLILPIPIFKRKKKETEGEETELNNEGEETELNNEGEETRLTDEGEETRLTDEGEKTGLTDEGNGGNGGNGRNGRRRGGGGGGGGGGGDDKQREYRERANTSRIASQTSKPWRQQTGQQRKQPRKDRAHNYSSSHQLRNYERRDGKGSRMPMPNKKSSTGKRKGSRK